MREGQGHRAPIRVREYGSEGPTVLVLHGGPGAPGYMAPVAEKLSHRFRALEPLQRGSGPEPLTVARHVRDLHEIAGSLPGPIHIVGHSWGAMLALAYASAHPGVPRSLALVGCGTFDVASRSRMRAIREQRTTDALRRQLDAIAAEIDDPDDRLRRTAEVSLPLDSFDLAGSATALDGCDARAHEETWNDMIRLQEEGLYPARFDAIECPVIMLHGNADPHPGAMIRDTLSRLMPQLEYHEWSDCGHYPWLERAVGDVFYSVLEAWLDGPRRPPKRR